MCLAFSAPAYADEQAPAAPRDHALTSGLGVGVGAGYESGNAVGGHVLYYQQLANPRWRLAFHLGAGARNMIERDVAWGVTSGTFVAFGKRNRLTLGVHYGAETTQFYQVYGVSWRDRPVFGAGIGAGYELVTRRGFSLRLNFGPSLYVTRATPFYDREVLRGWSGNITLGWKLW